MSGIAKGVSKVFKKVAQGIGKYGPALLAAGALFFTAGSALGVTSSWADTVSGVMGKLGAGSTLTGILSSAVTTAGYGAVAGGAVGALGGDAMGGMQMGAAGGAIVGAVDGALSAPPSGTTTGPDAASKTAVDATKPVSVEGAAMPSDAARGPDNSLVRVNGGGGSDRMAGGAGNDAIAPVGAGNVSANAADGRYAGTTAGRDAVYGAGGGAAAPSGGSMLDSLFDKGGWLERNQSLTGNVVSGLGKGLLTANQGDAYAQAREREYQMIAGNYAGAGRGLLTGASAPSPDQPPAGPTPAQRFGTPPSGAGQWVYDKAKNRFVFQAAAQPARA
jgi:hypothetical protein